MKICYFSCSTIYGGIEKIVIDSINNLSSKYQATLIVPKGCQYKDKIASSVRVIEYNSFDKRYNLFLYKEIYDILKSQNLVHTHGAKATQITYILSKFLPFIHVATKHNTRKGKIFNRLKHVISVSKKVSNTIIHESKTIYFGIKPQRVEHKKPDIFTMVSIGRLDPIKGFDKLIYSVSKLQFDFRLYIVGDGEQKEHLKSIIEQNGLKKKVFLSGFQKDIPQILTSCNLQIISSIKEGFPIALIEGIMYSPVILSTPVGGISEILDSSFLTSMGDMDKSIKNIYENYDTIKKEFQTKHEKFKHILTLDNYMHNLEKYYKEISSEQTS